ncbi:MAG: 4Fe-4S dicluster domain-containing protein [Anaerolineae bacterium]|nr:4Fe-4S dicluster domain-containing protein [Anaerolineae bacterium]
MSTKSDEVVGTQGKEDLPEVYVDDLLMSIKYFTDENEVHLQLIDPETCVACDKPCVSFCPVGAYQVQEDGHVTIAFQSCIECGSCRVMCPHNNIEWKYPRGGFGVSYKFG